MLTIINLIGLAMFAGMWLQLHRGWLDSDNPRHIAFFFVYMTLALAMVLAEGV